MSRSKGLDIDRYCLLYAMSMSTRLYYLSPYIYMDPEVLKRWLVKFCILLNEMAYLLHVYGVHSEEVKLIHLQANVVLKRNRNRKLKAESRKRKRRPKAESESEDRKPKAVPRIEHATCDIG
jgi:hypothetical protein